MVSTQNNTVSRSKVDITGVPETMLQTLYARESRIMSYMTARL